VSCLSELPEITCLLCVDNETLEHLFVPARELAKTQNRYVLLNLKIERPEPIIIRRQDC
jgi:hypothetical protein